MRGRRTLDRRAGSGSAVSGGCAGVGSCRVPDLVGAKGRGRRCGLCRVPDAWAGSGSVVSVGVRGCGVASRVGRAGRERVCGPRCGVVSRAGPRRCEGAGSAVRVVSPPGRVGREWACGVARGPRCGVAHALDPRAAGGRYQRDPQRGAGVSPVPPTAGARSRCPQPVPGRQPVPAAGARPTAGARGRCLVRSRCPVRSRCLGGGRCLGDSRCVAVGGSRVGPAALRLRRTPAPAGGPGAVVAWGVRPPRLCAAA
ncbi:hypothetical protein HNP84_003627 [Thermocatellispora tengchongensis]|uniref:Uncharacterized protein n=1 Tax=Thermocatellispora tengchongensis TaxID=1073253 RepID=A0A840P7R1_9ACTN|nr:hypothetical protein [Thermocatellispora tengchongensis]